MDELASGDSFIHRLHPLVKLLFTVLYIVLVVSFGKYELSGIIVMLLVPVLLYQVSGIPVSSCFYKLRYILPLVMAVSIFNPFFDKTPLVTVGRVTISGGVISMLTLMIKGILSLMASFLLMATTTLDSLCCALRKLHVPSLLVTLLLLTFRYVSLLIEQVSVMTEAYHLRAPGQKGLHISAWGSFLGQLLLRTMDRAGELYDSMQLRGFTGEFPYAAPARFSGKDAAVLILGAAVLLFLRFVNIAQLLGNLFVR